MGVLIDSSVLIEWERQRFDVTPFVARRADEAFFISVVTVSELLHGVYRARDERQKLRRSAFVEMLIAECEALDIDVRVARLHGELSASLIRQGVAVGSHDLWIGCTAIAHGLTLVTYNLKDFQKIPGLRLETWGRPPHQVREPAQPFGKPPRHAKSPKPVRPANRRSTRTRE